VLHQLKTTLRPSINVFDCSRSVVFSWCSTGKSHARFFGAHDGDRLSMRGAWAPDVAFEQHADGLRTDAFAHDAEPGANQRFQPCKVSFGGLRPSREAENAELRGFFTIHV